MGKYFFLFLTLFSFAAQAQDVRDLNLLHFKMGTDPGGLVTLEGARMPAHLQWHAGTMLSYAYRPLVMDLVPGGTTAIVSHQVLWDLAFSIGLWNRLALGVHLQGVPHQSGEDLSGLGLGADEAVKRFALADVRLLPRVLLWQMSPATGLALAFAPIVTLPTATSGAGAGEDGVTFEPRLLADWRFSNGAFLLAQAGYRWRKGIEIANLRVDDELVWGLGAEIPVAARISAVAEAWGAMGFKDAGGDSDSGVDTEEVPAEALAAARFRHASGLVLTAGAGTGITYGYGSPRARVFLAAGYSPVPGKSMDADEDGIPDAADRCPADPEDKNGFEDADGCPDAARDTDADGIPDMHDKCVSDPEDKNGFEDADGCPDATRDTDRDGIPDASDKCPAEPEDADGFEDADGCPDADNDGDGFCDPWVAEKGQAEKFLSVCKSTDKCPNEKEIINGVEDEDGCPDKGQEKIQITKDALIILDRIYFETAKATLLKQSFPILDMVVSVMKMHTNIELIEIQGHTDDVGDDGSNLKLSDERTKSVMKYLISKGVEPQRLTQKGFGETVPLQDCTGLKRKALDDCRARNRRVEFKILRMGKGKGE